MEYTFENGVMMGLLLADSCTTGVDEDEISKIKNGLLKYILQKGIYQGTVTLPGGFSEKYYCGLYPRRDDPAAEVFLCTSYGSEYTALGPNIITTKTTNYPERITEGKPYKVLNLYSGEDVGLANQYLARGWAAHVWFKGGKPLGASFGTSNRSMKMSYGYIYTYPNKNGYGNTISHIYLYPKNGYTDVTLKLPTETISGEAEYICDSRTGDISQITSNAVSENILASYKAVTYNVQRPKYTVVNSDGTITEKTDYSAKPILYATATTEYTEKFIAEGAGSGWSGLYSIPFNITDLSPQECMDLQKEYIETVIKMFKHKRNNSVYEIKRFLSYVEEEV